MLLDIFMHGAVCHYFKYSAKTIDVKEVLALPSQELKWK